MASQNGKSGPSSEPTAAGGGTAAAGSNTAPFLPYHDLRQWLDEAHKLGEVKEVGGLSYQADIGMVCLLYTSDAADE